MTALDYHRAFSADTCAERSAVFWHTGFAAGKVLLNNIFLSTHPDVHAQILASGTGGDAQSTRAVTGA